jgi:hypothetical protein
MDYSYDELYGVDLTEYLKRTNKSRDKLIFELNQEIKMLKENLQEKIEELGVTDPLIGSIWELLQKKVKHLKRIKKWKPNN